MKKYLTLVAVMCAAFLVALSIRLGLRNWAPAVYSALWGPVLVYQPAATVAAADVSSQGEAGGKPGAPIGESRTEKKQLELDHDDTKELYATGRIWGKGLSWVVMSDGTVRSTDDNTEPDKPRLERIRRHYMDFAGKRYYYKGRQRETELQGAGAKGAPERPDTEVPVVAVPAVTGPDRTAADQSSGRSAGANVSDAAPSTAGSWYVDKYGVNRLRESSPLKTAFSR